MENRRFAWLLLVLLLASGQAPGGPVHDAVNAGKLEQVKGLVASNPGLVNEEEVHGWTPLFLAAAIGHKAMVEFLLNSGARIDARDKDGDTPLHEAAANARKPVVELLLARGANVNLTNNSGMTPLHRVARDGYGSDHQAVIDVLLANKADAGARDKSGRTPLEVAIKERRQEMANHLRSRAAQR
jgi:ankyrin repeat protein